MKILGDLLGGSCTRFDLSQRHVFLVPLGVIANGRNLDFTFLCLNGFQSCALVAPRAYAICGAAHVAR